MHISWVFHVGNCYPLKELGTFSALYVIVNAHFNEDLAINQMVCYLQKRLAYSL